jgi:hypothetical protein
MGTSKLSSLRRIPLRQRISNFTVVLTIALLSAAYLFSLLNVRWVLYILVPGFISEGTIALWGWTWGLGAAGGLFLLLQTFHAVYEPGCPTWKLVFLSGTSSLLWGTLAGSAWFSSMCFIGAMPAISIVSLSLSFRPFSRNVTPSVIFGLIVAGCFFHSFWTLAGKRGTGEASGQTGPHFVSRTRYRSDTVERLPPSC